MAIRERKGRACPWQCYWNNPFTGKRESVSFATRKEAEKHDSLIKHRLRFERESFKPEIEEGVNESQAELTLESVYILYLREKQFSRKSLQWQLDAMRSTLLAYGTSPLADLTPDKIEALMQQMLATSVKPITVRKRFAVLRSVLRWAESKDYLQGVRFPKLPSAQYERFVPLSPTELGALLAVAPQHIQRVIIIGAQCGARVGPCELLRLQWPDVDFDAGLIRIHGAKKNPNAPWREVPIRESLVPLFRQWRAEDEAQGASHIVHFHGKAVQSIKTAWRHCLARAGITRRIRPYDLCHAFATELIAAGTDIGTVAKLMGHSTPTMLLKHYQYVMDGQKRNAVEALPDLAYVPKPMCPKNEAATALQ